MTQSMTAQAEAAFAAALAGISADDVTLVIENVTRAGTADYAELAAVRSRLIGDKATVRTIAVEGLIGTDALLQIELSTAGEADGLVHLPTVLPLDADGQVVSPGDFVAQYRFVLEKAGELLEAHGLTLGHAVTTFDYSTPDTRDVYRKTHWARKELLGQNEGNVYPCAGGILMSELHAPGVMVALDVTASRQPLELVNPGWSRYDTLTYAPGIKAGRMLFMSGFAALDMETQQALHDGDLGKQAEVTYGAIEHLLTSEGLTFADLVETTEYTVASYVDDHAALVAARASRLDAWPVHTDAICHSLLRPEFGLEVFPVAVYPADHPRIAGGA